jgi:hypothetical protein
MTNKQIVARNRKKIAKKTISDQQKKGIYKKKS